MVVQLIYKGSCPKTKSYILELKTLSLIFHSFISHFTDMDVLNLLRKLSNGELHSLHELEEHYPYTVVAVDRITNGPHHWCILTLKKEDASNMKVLLETEVF